MAKPQPIRVPSDDCIVTLGRVVREGKVISEGIEYALHEGEWVDVLPGLRIEDYGLLAASRELQVKIDALADDDDRTMRSIVLSHEAHEETVKALQARVVSWNWTDDQGEPLPQPKDDPTVFNRLHFDEFFWLSSAIRNETVGQMGNDSRPSETSSSVTAPQTTPASSAGDRSPSMA